MPFPPPGDLPDPGIEPGSPALAGSFLTAGPPTKPTKEIRYSAKMVAGPRDVPGGSDGKASVYNVGDLGLIPGSGRSAGEGDGNPLQYYCLENPTDRGA